MIESSRADIVGLTPREHYFALKLLERMCEGETKKNITSTIKLMSTINHKLLIHNSRQYETSRKIIFYLLHKSGQKYLQDIDVQNQILARHNNLENIFKNGVCSRCNINPRAINYIKDGKTHYRSLCNKCITANNSPTPVITTKNTCSVCGFVAKFPAQLVDVTINNSSRVVCLNCQVGLTTASKINRLSPIADL